MDAAFAEGLIRLFERSTLAELEFSDAAGDRLHLVRHGVPAASPAASAPSPRDAPASAPALAHAPDASPGTVTVAAGLHGTFFRGSGPGQPPFVAEGDMVEEGQVLAILEAMKVLNHVEAEAAGRIVAVLAGDGETVAPGTPLFTLQPGP